ncbi:STAS domain-containing protein [Fictibacillus sp. 23RED33]|uniref:STAS domain-containing protein n=1 Tax=Fictibacillus sp. 23RED33 TaxID=2745879 RepID=UPI0018CD5EB0|nr:STAS domain-containing protein [Fictibacillus sp. 23RED33]MBH0175747.1 STAS domain-containing protein [Fictibacillus sp. 23RED33]
MKKEIELLGEIILNRKHEIAEQVHSDRMAEVVLTEQERREFELIEPKIMELRASFITLFGEALVDFHREESIEKIARWGRETGEYLFQLGAPLDEALKDTSFYREYIWRAIKEEVIKKNMSTSTIFVVIDTLDPLLDHAVYCFSLNYVQSYQKVLEQAKSAFLELSIPVVPLTQGTGVLPLIGNIDTERAKLLMEETMNQAIKLNLQNLIIDVSGVMFVDSMVADQLFKVVEGLSLLGVKTVMTGIRPEVAQTMVALGLNMHKLNIKGNLHQAFNEIQMHR